MASIRAYTRTFTRAHMRHLTRPPIHSFTEYSGTIDDACGAIFAHVVLTAVAITAVTIANQQACIRAQGVFGGLVFSFEGLGFSLREFGSFFWGGGRGWTKLEKKLL